MAAEVGIYVYVTTDAANESTASQTGIDLCSADTSVNSSTNRAAYPITAGSNSFEKWTKAKAITSPDNYLENFALWGDGAVQASTTMMAGTQVAGTTPTTVVSIVAVSTWSDYTNNTNASLAWHANSLTSTGSTTDYAVYQLVVEATADAGNWTQETINYSYDEA